MRSKLFVLIILAAACTLPAACGGTTTPTPVTPAATVTPTPADLTPRVQIRWLTGTVDPGPIEAAMADFNASQDRIELSLANSAEEADILGPVDWAGLSLYRGQLLDMSAAIEAAGFDTSVLNEELVMIYQSEEGQIGLPFSIAPAALYYVPARFDNAGLDYPPSGYGEAYRMPDGTMKPWNWETLAEIARLLTLDRRGRNATEENFDRAQIAQVGYVPQWQHPFHMAGFWGAAAAEYYDPVTLRAHVPEESEQAWSWYYDGIWGSQPFIASGDLANSASFGSGNVFASGRAAMAAASSWYTCCLDDFAAAGNVFQLAALPASPGDGALHARLEIGSFHIFKNTGHPDEAFETVSYLITSARVAQGLDVLSAINGLWDLYIQSRAERYPFVSSWQPLLDGITQADMSLANGYLPNYGEAWIRVGTFGDRLATIAALDLDAELSTLEDDLTAIFQR